MGKLCSRRRRTPEGGGPLCRQFILRGRTVKPRNNLWWRLLVGSSLTLGLLGVWAVPSHSEELSRQQQIAEIEKQIQELNKKLEELRKADGLPKTTLPAGTIDPEWVKSLSWRCIGPAAMGGRIVAVSAFEADPCTYWIATASGGLLKTTNNGVTFEHQFDHEATVSIGDVAVAQADRNVVWVGTGENNPRNSVSYGDGVYKSTDGGKSWKNMGLTKTFQIGRIAIHPKNPNIVYVGALGRLYGYSEERGVFKTTDGGEHWERVLSIDDRTGIIDLQINPADPETVIAAAWERQRDGFDSHPGNEMPPAEGYDRYDPIKKWGPGSGLYRTTDGGKKWTKLTTGLPTSPMGRIGIDYYRKDPKTVYAVIDCEKIGMGPPPVYLGVQGEDTPGGAKLTQITPDGPAAKAGLKQNDVVKSIDKKDLKTYDDLVDEIAPHKPSDKVTLSVQRDKETKEIVVTLELRPEGPPGLGGGGGRANVYAGILGEPVEGGVRLSQVVEDSPADKVGLKVGDVLKSIDKKDVTTLQQVSDALRDKKPGDKVTLQVLREKEPKEFVLPLDAPPVPPGSTGRNRPYSFAYGGQRENSQIAQGPEGYLYGGVYKSTDGGESWTRINSLNPRPMYFSQVRVDPSDDKYLYVLGISLYRSSDGGKKFKADGSNGVHPDQHCLWIDPKDGRHMIVGCDGGFYATYDRMDNWDHLNNMAIGQFYHVAVDSRRPYRVYGGLQDNGSWGGPSNCLSGPPINEDWILVGGGDGFVCRVDPTDPDLVYFESQDGNINRRNLRTGESAGIRLRRERSQPPYRFNWNSPFILSSHNPRLFYSAGNYVFRSLKQGDDLRVVSPEITRTKRGSGTALAESPRNPDVLWVGTDDGNLWVTRDGGAVWSNVVDKVGLPGPRWVASIEPSRTVEGRAYVVFDGHRSDDDIPLVYVTEDFGQTWKSLKANLPSGSTRVLREDIENDKLLYLGTEFGAWASLNRGESWTRINNNLPTVAVHEFAQPVGVGEVVAATHGRSLWVCDVSALRQMTPDALKAKAFLFKPDAAVRWRSEPARGSPYGTGSRHFYGQNPPRGAQIYYSLTTKPEKISLKVVDYAGKTVRELQVKNELGLHRLTWDLNGQPPIVGQGSPGTFPQREGFFRRVQPQAVLPGMYRLVLTVDGQELTQSLRIEADPTGAGQITVDVDDEEEREKKASRKIDD
jgi:photosystem II stability/assembly factor-like uncharacterized protein